MLLIILLSSSTYYSDYREDEHSDPNQLNDSLGELVTVKTLEGNTINVYLRLGNRILFCSGKYFYLEYTVGHDVLFIYKIF